jgi:hypothetical protein
MTIGIIREGKIPPDSRVPLIPEQCKKAKEQYGFEVIVQRSPTRCFADEDYTVQGIQLAEDMNNCDILFGVKEVPIKDLIPDKTYFFFSHTIKKQAYNQDLLRAILSKNIRLIDYEVLTDENGKRVIAFGKFAGMVGAHNAIWTYFKRHRLADMPRMYTFPHYEDAVNWYKNNLKLPPIKVLLTGTGRVANGARRVLEDMGLKAVSPQDYLEKSFDHAVFTQLSSLEYVRKIDGAPHSKEEFYAQPEKFTSAILPYARVSEVFINGIFWNPAAPAFFSNEDMLHPDFKIEVIADVTCDIAPDSSIPCTLKPSTIADPVYGYDPQTGEACEPFKENCVDVMAIDNLPNELARDASTEFGNVLLDLILPELLKPHSEMLERATVTEGGRLGKNFQYLSDFAGLKHEQA